MREYDLYTDITQSHLSRLTHDEVSCIFYTPPYRYTAISFSVDV